MFTVCMASIGGNMSISIFLDMAAALAVTALLAESYGIVRRRFVRNGIAPIVLGTLFGIMSLVQMHNPVEPYEGLIIDLRNIPVALAGAFLGWRGLVPCLAIALLARLGLGGVGAASGMWGMVIAGLAGMIWARKMSAFPTRNFGALLLLALAMSSHMLAALILPRDLAVWFYTSAAGPILAMNLFAVPLIGALLERENQRILRESKQAAVALRDPNTGLLTGQAFVREVTNAFAAHPLDSFAGVLVITPQISMWRSLFVPRGRVNAPEVDARLFSTLLTHWTLAGRSKDGRILIPINHQELETVHRLRAAARDLLSDSCLDGQSPLYWSVSEIATEDPGRFLQLIEQAAEGGQSNWADRSPAVAYSAQRASGASLVRRSKLFNPDEHDALFAKANFLIERGRS